MIATSRHWLPLVAVVFLAGCQIPATGESRQQAASPLESPSPSGSDGSPASSSPGKSPGRSIDEVLLFFPAKFPDGQWAPKGLTFEDVWFNAADGTRLHGWYCPCDDARAAVLYCHGNGGNVSYCSRDLALLQHRLRVSVLAFDYRGYGRSHGVPTVEGVLKDARAARQLLAKRAGLDPAEVVLMGRSLGGAVAVRLASEAAPRGLILESTFSSLREVASQHYPALAWVVPPEKLNSVSAISRYDGPLLQSHGSADRTISYASGKRLFAAAKGPKTFVTIPRGDHNDPQTEDYYRKLDGFLDGLPAARTAGGIERARGSQPAAEPVPPGRQ